MLVSWWLGIPIMALLRDDPYAAIRSSCCNPPSTDSAITFAASSTGGTPSSARAREAAAEAERTRCVSGCVRYCFHEGSSWSDRDASDECGLGSDIRGRWGKQAARRRSEPRAAKRRAAKAERKAAEEQPKAAKPKPEKPKVAREEKPAKEGPRAPEEAGADGDDLEPDDETASMFE